MSEFSTWTVEHLNKNLELYVPGYLLCSFIFRLTNQVIAFRN